MREQKANELAELLTTLDYNNADAETIDRAVSELRVKYERVADEAKRVATEALEVRHAKAELELKRAHLVEIVAATEAAGGESSEREKALKMQAELAEYEEALEAKRKERIASAKGAFILLF